MLNNKSKKKTSLVRLLFNSPYILLFLSQRFNNNKSIKWLLFCVIKWFFLQFFLPFLPFKDFFLLLLLFFEKWDNIKRFFTIFSFIVALLLNVIKMIKYFSDLINTFLILYKNTVFPPTFFSSFFLYVFIIIIIHLLLLVIFQPSPSTATSKTRTIINS